MTLSSVFEPSRLLVTPYRLCTSSSRFPSLYRSEKTLENPCTYLSSVASEAGESNV